MTLPLTLKTNLKINGVWTDVSASTRQKDGYFITRGRKSEGSTADASTCTQTYDNSTGDFSPRNPRGQYFGYIGRNTPQRVYLPSSTSYLYVPRSNSGGNYISCPDNARLDITGDLDIRIDAWFATITWNSAQDLIGKYNVTGNQRSYALVMSAGGYPRLLWSNDGTTVLQVVSSYPVPAPISGRRAIRATLDVNNGSGGYTVTFYTASSMSGTWVQLDQTATTGGTTSIYNSTTSLYVGDIAGSSTWATAQQHMKVYSAQVLNGIAGTAAANPDFTIQTDEDNSFADAAGNTWTVAGSALIVAKNWKFHGEVSEWPPRSDTTNTDKTVSVTASGILRRLGGNTEQPIKSAYYRAATSTVAPVTDLVAYWPCEDGSSATSIAPGIASEQPGFISGTPSLAADSTSFACSSALPTMGTASFVFSIPTYASTGYIQTRFLLAIPAAGTTNGAIVMRLRCLGTAVRWDLVYGTGGTLQLIGYNSAGTALVTTAAGAFGLNGATVRVGLALSQNGADIDYSYSVLPAGSSSGTFTSGTLAANTVGTATQVELAASKNMSGVTTGHLHVQKAVTSVFDLDDALAAYSGELATERFIRLCEEESIAPIVLGETATAIQMGPQTQVTLLAALRECETADQGMIFEPKEFFGLGYISKEALMSQNTALTLDYTAGELSDEFRPIEDDATIANNVTVTRPNGSSYRYVVSTGALSTQEHPNGVGVYNKPISANVYTDSLLEGVASWAAHIGTVNEPRFQAIGVNPERAVYQADAALLASVENAGIGQKLVVQNPPDDMPPDNIEQLIIGYTERLNTFEHEYSFVGMPESPYHVAIWDSVAGSEQESRYSPSNCTVDGAHAAPVTSLAVLNNGGLPWSHADGDFDIMVSGCRFTVTAVAAAVGDTQTLTVTLVNGIAKTIPTGAQVELFHKVYWS